MSLFKKSGLLLLFVPVAWAAPVSDTVNERIPVSRAELEAHWRVDCETLSKQLVLATAWERSDEACRLEPSLHRHLQLCAFIHQPPGGDSEHKCPDFRGAMEALEQSGPGTHCTELAIFLGGREPCSPLRPAE